MVGYYRGVGDSCARSGMTVFARSGEDRTHVCGVEMACPAVAVREIVPSSVCGIDVLVFPDRTCIDCRIRSCLVLMAAYAIFEICKFDRRVMEIHFGKA